MKYSKAWTYCIAFSAVALSSSIDASVKFVSIHSGILVLLAWRFLFGAIIAFSIYFARSRQKIRSSSIGFHAFRGVLQLISVFLYFYSITRLSLAEATIVSFTSVLFVAPVAALFLGERISNIAAIAAAIGFFGIIVSVYDGGAAASEQLSFNRVTGLGAGVVSGLLTAVLLVLLRMRSSSEDPYVISLFTNLAPAIMLLPVTSGIFGRPGAVELMAFFGLGIMGYSVWFLLTVAYSRLPAQFLAPTEYIGVIIAAIYGYLFFDELLRLQTVIGGTLIIGACILITRATDKPSRSVHNGRSGSANESEACRHRGR